MTTTAARPALANASYEAALAVLALSAFAAAGMGVLLVKADSLFMTWVILAVFPALVGGLAGWLRVSPASACLVGVTTIVTVLASINVAATGPRPDGPEWQFWVVMAMFAGTQVPFFVVAYVGARAFRSAKARTRTAAE